MQSLDESELRAMVLELAGRDPGVRRALELRVSARSGDITVLSDELVAMVRDGLSVRGFVDYRRSFEVARQAQEVLDELESMLDAGQAVAASAALLRAVTRLRTITEHADDSSGSIGDANQRAADLYARACREGRPDGKKLARWLVKFRDTSPGWPDLTLEDFVAAFDEPALATYRREVAKVDRAHAADDHWKRFEIRQMLLELADHDGDVDRAVELLTEGEHPSYGSVVERLRSVGRDDEAVGWIDRAVAEGRVSGQNGGNDYWLDPAAVADTYRELGRVEDGLAVLRTEFERRTGFETFRQLLSYAAAAGREVEERAWALERAAGLARSPYPGGSALVEIALGEDDLEAAWSAARQYGAGHLWQRLAQASVDFAPLEAAELHRAPCGEGAVVTDTKRYPGIADHLATMRDLHRRAGTEDRFADYIAELRDTYQRRTSLMKEWARAGTLIR